MTIETQLSATELTDEFQLNGFESGAQFGSSVLALSGGGFAVVYGNHFDTTDTLAVSIYSADGVPVETATGTYVLPYTGSAADVQMLGDPVIAENADGSILLRWNSDDDTFGSGSDLYTASISPADGSITRTQSLVQNSTEIGNFALTVANNGYQHTLYQSSVFENLHLNVKDADGDHVGLYSIGDAFDDFDSLDIVTLSNGNVLIATTEEGTSSTNPVYVQIRSATGPVISPLLELDPVGPSDADTDIKLAALSDGGFAIAYASEVDGTDGVTLYILNDQDSLENPTAIRVDTNLAAVESAVDIAALNNGWVAVSWTETNAEGGTDIRGRVFDGEGTALTDAVLLSSGETDADDSSIAALNNGSIVVSWTDALADSDGDSIQGKILAAALNITGDDLDNTLIGGLLDDEIRGGGGNDSINGFGGNDFLNGQAGDDTIDGDVGDDSVIGGTGDDSLYGWFGNDTLEGSAGNDTLQGEEGNDSLLGGAGSDMLFGGNGDDYLNPGNASGIDYVQPGVGDDTVDFRDVTSPDALVEIDNYGLSTGVTVAIDGAANTGSIDKGPDGKTTIIDINRAMLSELGGAIVYGSAHNDVFNINPVTDGFLLVMGMAGNDIFNILNGDGFIRYGSSWWNATTGMNIDLSTGIVSEDGYGGQDTINGVENLGEVRTTMLDDGVIGSDGDDQIILMAGNDTADGGGGFDTLRYNHTGVEAVNVNLNTGTATGTWRGEAFNHQISNFEEIRGSYDHGDTLTGKDGQDNRIEGQGGKDTVQGGENGNDTLDGGDGNDSLIGLSGDDSIIGGSGKDVLRGDAGSDTLLGGLGGDTLLGGDQADSLVGDDGRDELFAGEGADTLEGGDGNDTLGGSDGEDQIYGQLGNDIAYGGQGNDFMDGGEGNDQFFAGAGDDTVFGRLGDDALGGAAGNDRIFGEDGNDTLFGGKGKDVLGGGNDNDSLLGGGGDDTLFGGAGDDTLLGGAGNDSLSAGSGADRLDGGTGNDTLRGGGDGDTFVFSDGIDQVADFGAGDRIDLSGVAAITDFADLQATHLSGGANAVISDGLGNTLTLLNVAEGSLIEGDFIFAEDLLL